MGPKLSVVVASFSGEDAVTLCLKSLAQPGPSIEVIVVTKGEGESLERIKERFPFARFIRASRDASVFRLRSIGVREASGQVVAMTEDHCTVSPTWAEDFLKAADAGHPIVGGPVDNGLNDRAYDWALYFCEYATFMPPVSGGPAAVLSGVNVLYLRELLLSCRSVWKENFYENEVHDTLRTAGYSLYMVGSAWVKSHLRMDLNKAIAHLFSGGKRFGKYRQSRTSAATRLVRLLTSPAVPFVLFGRIVKTVLSRRPGQLGAVLSGLPYMLCLLLAWSAGETVGYLKGAFGEGN